MVTRIEAENAHLAAFEENYVRLADSVAAIEEQMKIYKKNLEEHLDDK